MQVKKEVLSAPIKFTVTVEAQELVGKKKAAFDKVKDDLVVQGFRKGHVTQEVAEDKVGVNALYRSVIDEIYTEVAEQCNIVSSRDFKFYGNFKKDIPLIIEFVSDVKPEVGNVPIDLVKDQIKMEVVEVTEDDLKNRIDFEIKQNEKIIDTDKQVCENFDVAVIDFEGTIVGETKPFQGGTAKGYQISVNEIINGRKQFIDTFEDQIVGMKIGETKDIKVKFPNDYKDTTKAGKDAVFVVTLNSLKQKQTPLFDEFVKKIKGENSVEEYKESLRKIIFNEKQKKANENYKKQLVSEIVKQSEIPSIPQAMIENETQREWDSFLRRMDKTEEQFVKENKNSKEHFFDTNSSRSTEVIKTTLVLEKIAKDKNIVVTEEDVVSYVMKVSSFLQHDGNRKEKILLELTSNKHQYRLMEIATRNEKVLEFLSK